MVKDRRPFFIKESRWCEITRTLKISGRESEIIQYIMAGETEGEIASSLGISAHTVHTHLERLYNKLKVNSRAQLITRIFAEYVSLDTSCNGDACKNGSDRNSEP